MIVEVSLLVGPSLAGLARAGSGARQEPLVEVLATLDIVEEEEQGQEDEDDEQAGDYDCCDQPRGLGRAVGRHVRLCHGSVGLGLRDQGEAQDGLDLVILDCAKHIDSILGRDENLVYKREYGYSRPP